MVAEQFQGIGQPHQMPRRLQLEIGFQQMPALVPPLVSPQTIFLHVQQLGQSVVAFRHVNVA